MQEVLLNLQMYAIPLSAVDLFCLFCKIERQYLFIIITHFLMLRVFSKRQVDGPLKRQYFCLVMHKLLGIRNFVVKCPSDGCLVSLPED